MTTQEKGIIESILVGVGLEYLHGGPMNENRKLQ